MGKNGHICRKRKSCFTTSVIAMVKIHELRFELLDHPPYPPDLAPSDFFCARRTENEEAITFVNSYFAEKNPEYYLDELQKWEQSWEKCVELQGDYVEK